VLRDENRVDPVRPPPGSRVALYVA